MKARCWLVAAAVLSLLPAAARAEGLAGRFTIAAQVGTQSEVSGNMIQSASGTLLDRTVTIDSLRYRDIYAPELRLQGLFGYGVGDAHRSHRPRDLVQVDGRQGDRGRHAG